MRCGPNKIDEASTGTKNDIIVSNSRLIECREPRCGLGRSGRHYGNEERDNLSKLTLIFEIQIRTNYDAFGDIIEDGDSVPHFG